MLTRPSPSPSPIIRVTVCLLLWTVLAFAVGAYAPVAAGELPFIEVAPD